MYLLPKPSSSLFLPKGDNDRVTMLRVHVCVSLGIEQHLHQIMIRAAECSLASDGDALRTISDDETDGLIRVLKRPLHQALRGYLSTKKGMES